MGEFFIEALFPTENIPMQFEIPCPNGHTVRFSLKLAGRLCQCPKCSAKIPIPSLDELRESLGDDADPEVEEAFREAAENQAKHEAALKAKLAAKAAKEATEKEKPAVPEPPENPVPVPEAEELIEFACPNGHQLSAALDQAGKPGTCPECGTRFLVPEADEDDEEEDESDALPEAEMASPFDFTAPQTPVVVPPPVGAPAGGKKSPVSRASNKSSAPQAFLFPDLAVDGETGGLDFGLEQAGERIPALAKVDPMARLFWKFWDRRGDDTVIELHTADGRVYIPEDFFEDESLGEIGMFTVQNASAHPVTIGIRWANICRIQEKE